MQDQSLISRFQVDFFVGLCSLLYLLGDHLCSFLFGGGMLFFESITIFALWFHFKSFGDNFFLFRKIFQKTLLIFIEFLSFLFSLLSTIDFLLILIDFFVVGVYLFILIAHNSILLEDEFCDHSCKFMHLLLLQLLLLVMTVRFIVRILLLLLLLTPFLLEFLYLFEKLDKLDVFELLLGLLLAFLGWKDSLNVTGDSCSVNGLNLLCHHFLRFSFGLDIDVILLDSLVVLLQGKDDTFSQLIPLLFGEDYVLMKIIIMVESKRSLHSVDKRDHEFIQHDSSRCWPLLIWNIIATAVISKDVGAIREQLGEDSAFVVLRLCKIVGRSKDKHIFLSRVAMEIKIEVDIMSFWDLIH
jgi:hypothetical protein